MKNFSRHIERVHDFFYRGVGSEIFLLFVAAGFAGVTELRDVARIVYFYKCIGFVVAQLNVIGREVFFN